MCGEADELLRQRLRVTILALEVGHWRSVFLPGSTSTASGAPGGSAGLVRLGGLLRMVARSMQLQMHGRVRDAWDQLDAAAAALPAGFRGRGSGAELLPPRPPDSDADAALVWAAGRVIWRERSELSVLRARVAPMGARDLLIEAVVEDLCWVDLDPFTYVPPASPFHEDGTRVERTSAVVRSRGTDLRRFADATACRISPHVWDRAGGYRGLRAEALLRLAERPIAAPWCADDRALDLSVRAGRLIAWNHAREWFRCVHPGNAGSRMP